MNMRFFNRYLSFVLLTCLLTLAFVSLVQFLLPSKASLLLDKHEHLSERIPLLASSEHLVTQHQCRLHSCFDVARCRANEHWKIRVYIYPLRDYVDSAGVKLMPERTYEFLELLAGIRESPFYTDNITEACVLIPSVDLLSEPGLSRVHVLSVLNSLQSWNSGTNHLLFNMFPLLPVSKTNAMNLPLQSALLASANFHLTNMRKGYDVSLPVFNTYTALDPDSHSLVYSGRRKWTLVIAQVTMALEHRTTLRKVEDVSSSVLMLRKCLGSSNDGLYQAKMCKDGLTFDYLKAVGDGEFCLILPGYYYGSPLLLDAIMLGCVPVVCMNGYKLPFDDVIDWSRASVRISEGQLADVMDILTSYSASDIIEKRSQAFYLWKRYFSSLRRIAVSVLEILNERIFTHKRRSYEDWNRPYGSVKNDVFTPGASPPLFLPLRPAEGEGFTAIVLTFNRVQMLFTLLQQLDNVPSLAKMIVVWNNPYKEPPLDKWPRLSKPWKVIEARTNRLSNRFYPYDEIGTEAVLAIDDDILMLTVDEIEFGYKTWCEFPNRLVGFPGRVHITNPSELINGKKMKYKYESEWQNEVSMVLTGAAFYHKVYNHYYSYMLDRWIVDYVDDKMNCEDIAMNFLISNLTGLPPIKVTPRKRFKCPQCHGNDSLWSETSHFIKRSECLTVFSERFGHMPLQPVEFRVDPLLLNADVPDHVKEFPDLGTV